MSPDIARSSSAGADEAGSNCGSDWGLIVTGATGWIGRTVVAHARSQGRVVVGAGRQVDETTAARVIRFDLGDTESVIASRLEKCLQVASSWAVIHCAGLAHVKVEDRVSRDALHRINVDGTARMAKVCSTLGIQRFVQASTIAVYDWGTGQLRVARDETGRVGPSTAYGATKLEAERVAEQSGLDVRIVRLATVFGTGDKANFSRLAKAIRRRRFVIPGHGDQRKSCIDVDSAARTLIAIAGMPEPSHRLVNVAFPEAPTLAEISQTLAGVCGVPSPPHMPESLLRVAAWCGSRAASLGLPAPLTSSDLTKLCAWTWVDASRAVEIFPELRSRTFADAMPQAAQHYREC
jgi:nucleoside-diphosphate-sugar epimerase